jgi:adenylate cyclase
VSKHQQKYWVVSLKFCILAIFIGLFILARVMQLSLTTYVFQKTLSETSFQLMDSFSSHAVDVISASMNPIAVETQFAALMIKRGLLDVNNDDDLVNYMYDLVKKSPIIEGAVWGDIQGNFVYAEENYNKNGKVRMEIINRRSGLPTGSSFEYVDGKILNPKPADDVMYDPRTRPWYIQGITHPTKTTWTNVYYYKNAEMFFVSSVAAAHNKNGELLGVFGLDVRLDNLQRFVENYKVSKHGLIYFVNKQGELLAFPKIKQDINVKQNRVKLVNLKSLNQQLLVNSLAFYNKTGQERFKLSYQGEKYLFSYKSLPFLSEYGWYVVVMVPQSDFTKDLERLHMFSLILSLITFFIGIVLLSYLVDRVVKPIKYLVTETEKIKNFDLEHKVTIESRIKEVIALRDAMISMKSGLLSFQKYVPKSLVRKLIETNEDSRVGGVKIPLTILFSDICNFTTIAEMMDPDQLMIHLDDYYEHLSHIIIETGGTIDKYIGDSIMAFWGAPQVEEKSAYHAALSAVRCQRKLAGLNKTWKEQGKPVLITRFGIHFGDAIVGNLGSSERFNYTAIGDVVNTANRLEALNKNYGTRILVSHQVYAMIKDDFILRMVDCVAVKGRVSSGFVYELLAQYIDELSFDIDAYRDVFQRGFSAYTAQHWDEAIVLFERAIQLYPEDSVAPIFIARCEHLKTSPPSKQWDGVWHMPGSR